MPESRTPSRHLKIAAGSAALVAVAMWGFADVALAAESPFVSETFQNATTNSTNWVLPTAPTGTNVACLTASSNAAQATIPGCALGSPDASGSGTLRLTSAAGNKEGGVDYNQSLPITHGLDVVFNTYQYGGSSADGIGLFLAATDPTNPGPPAAIGQPGGNLGYSARTGTSGLSNGYLGIGFDVFGNYTNTVYEGSGCTDPAWLGVGTTVPHQVTIRGPGDGTIGYCAIDSTANPAHSIPAFSLHGASRVASKVPAEVVINSTASSITTPSGLTVPAGDYEVAFTPVGGSQVTLTGALPSTGNGEIPANTIPSAWINPVNGIPYQLTMGWVASTGGSTDIHEIDQSSLATANGALPILTKTVTEVPSSPAAGSNGAFDVAVGVSPSGGSENQSIHVVDILPTGLTPLSSGLGGTGWSCSISGQTVSCTYAIDPNVPVAAGTNLPALSIPFNVSAASGSVLASNSVTLFSNDVLPIGGVAGISVPATGAIDGGKPSPATALVMLAALMLIAGGAVLINRSVTT